jgi:hypothetical protein
MNTWLCLLKMGFWTWPLQRWCTVLGLGVIAGLGALLLGGGWGWSDVLVWGGLIGFAIPALLGGAMWRSLSAPRAIALAPFGRAKLLLAVMGVTVSVALLCLVYHYLGELSIHPRYRRPPAFYLSTFVGVFAGATWLAMASFIASRSPLATLLLLLATLGSTYLWWKLGIADPAILMMRSWGIGLPLCLWALFGIWYLRARRIRPPGWLLPGSQSVLATVVVTDTATAGLGQRAALERLLLGGASVLRLLAQWLLVFGALLILLALMAWQNEDHARSVAHFAFAALLLGPAVVAVQALAIVRQARVLWLPSGYSRAQLLAFTERTLLKFALGMALLFAGFLLLLWFTQPWRPAVTLPHALAVIVMPGLLLALYALSRPGGPAFYWPVVVAILWGIMWRPLTSVEPMAWADADINWAGAVGWQWIAAATAAILLPHLLARQRWKSRDLPRAATSR